MAAYSSAVDPNPHAPVIFDEMGVNREP